MSVNGSRFLWVLVLSAVLFAGDFITAEETPADKSGPRNQEPRPKVFHVVQELPAYHGGCTNRFNRISMPGWWRRGLSGTSPEAEAKQLATTPATAITDSVIDLQKKAGIRLSLFPG